MTSSQTPNFKPLKFEFQIIPVITREPVESERYKNFEQVSCTFEFRVGNDSYISIDALGSPFFGECVGSHWEDLQAQWLNQYNYIKRNIGQVLLDVGNCITIESELKQKMTLYQKWNTNWTSLIERINTRLMYVPDEIDQPALDTVLMLLTFYSSRLYNRLIGRTTARMRIGTTGGLRYTEEDMNHCINLIPRLQIKWHMTRKIWESGNRDWKDEALKEFKTIGFTPPEDLLEAMTQRNRKKRGFTYRPLHLGEVHAARICGIRSADGDLLRASNYKLVERAINQQTGRNKRGQKKPESDHKRGQETA